MPGSGPRVAYPVTKPARQRAPRAGVIVPPGRVPKPPECPADEAGPAGAAQASGVSAVHSRRLRPVLRPRLRLAPSNQRHRLTPLDEQGAVVCSPIVGFVKARCRTRRAARTTRLLADQQRPVFLA